MQAWGLRRIPHGHGNGCYYPEGHPRDKRHGDHSSGHGSGDAEEEHSSHIDAPPLPVVPPAPLQPMGIDERVAKHMQVRVCRLRAPPVCAYA